MSKSAKLNPDLWKRLEQHAKKAGYSSTEEFIEHVLEKELSRLEEAEAGAEAATHEEVSRRLKGLGYLE